MEYLITKIINNCGPANKCFQEEHVNVMSITVQIGDVVFANMHPPHIALPELSSTELPVRDYETVKV